MYSGNRFVLITCPCKNVYGTPCNGNDCTHIGYKQTTKHLAVNTAQKFNLLSVKSIHKLSTKTPQRQFSKLTSTFLYFFSTKFGNICCCWMICWTVVSFNKCTATKHNSQCMMARFSYLYYALLFITKSYYYKILPPATPNLPVYSAGTMLKMLSKPYKRTDFHTNLTSKQNNVIMTTTEPTQQYTSNDIQTLAFGDAINGNKDRKTCSVYSSFHADLSSEASRYDKHSINWNMTNSFQAVTNHSKCKNLKYSNLTYKFINYNAAKQCATISFMKAVENMTTHS